MSVVSGLNEYFQGQKIIQLPKYLLINLNRTTYNTTRGTSHKIYKKVFLDKLLVCRNRRYLLKAIIVHVGNTGGHFIIYIKGDDNWICCNDAKTYFISDYEINKLIEGDDYIDYQVNETLVMQNIVKIANTMRTATFLFYSSE